ncbi:nucleotidyltransferase family protein [Hypericibacter sp.]|uniref:nucleotidyltransferase family protein n=1 Tax=Hypericibacter sp. TaxID=2705401 RepID=UPI003D6C863E
MPAEAQRDRLLSLIASDDAAMAALRLARSLVLPDWAIGAGFLRNRLWDDLTGSRTCSPADDIDLLYFDAGDPEGTGEAAIEAHLAAAHPGLVWQARNQARMHRVNGDAPYADTEDALRHWLETCSAVAVRFERDDRLTLLAPYGLEDLFALVCRPTPAGLRRSEAYRARMAAKAWDRRWPDCRII